MKIVEFKPKNKTNAKELCELLASEPWQDVHNAEAIVIVFTKDHEKKMIISTINEDKMRLYTELKLASRSIEDNLINGDM